MERFSEMGGKVGATYRPGHRLLRIGTGNRLAGIGPDEE